MALVLCACGPSVSDDHQPVGELVLEGYLEEMYTDGVRVEIIAGAAFDRDDFDLEEYEPSCGYLTTQAMEDIEDVTRTLDPRRDYNLDRGGQFCGYSRGYSLLHLDGFEHSPFDCSLFCCNPELSPLIWVYTNAFTNLAGDVIEVEGQEPYIVIDPERSCPEP